MSIEFTTVAQAADVEQILALQAQNHRDVVDARTAATDGFTSVRHVPQVLHAMNRAYPSPIARSGSVLAGYCLMMAQDFRDAVPILQPMFGLLDGLQWRGQPLQENRRWFVMGQVCVARDFRGQGVFDGLYHHLRDVYRSRFDFTVTEISRRNPRSLQAHRRVGFETLHVYRDAEADEVWEVVVWDWRNGGAASEKDVGLVSPG
jgi:GNAT superfamily N-acetyltransferase